MKFIVVVGVLSFLVASEADAQRRCVKGIPCGNTCISASKTCRVGTSEQEKPASERTKPISPEDQAVLIRRITGDTGAKAKTSTEYGPFVGSVDGDVYYSSACNTSWKLTLEERIYFQSEQEALAKGYHRSRAKGC